LKAFAINFGVYAIQSHSPTEAIEATLIFRIFNVDYKENFSHIIKYKGCRPCSRLYGMEGRERRIC
jgi:hypothetical protein